MRASLVNLAPIETLSPWTIARPLLVAVAKVALALAAIAILSAVATGGVAISPSRLAPDPSRLNVFGGLLKIADRQRAWGALRGFVVSLAIALVVARVIASTLPLAGAVAGAPASTVAVAAMAARKVAIVAASIATAFAAIDTIVSLHLWRARLKMTRDEVVREHKESEGDPEVKRRREELRHELLAAQAIAAVREGTVVVVNPTHLACALKYRGGKADDGEADPDEAPTLLAKGEGALALRMIEAARVYGVPVVRDVPVARALYELETGTEIPEALYEAVAEVLRAAWEDGD
jgi:flagellar biosynthesis protein FlhB